MGFDFSRIEYDVPADVVRIDGQVPVGWVFTRFDLRSELPGARIEEYVGVIAQYMGAGDQVQTGVQAPLNDGWLKVYDGREFLQRAVKECVT